VCGLYNSGQSSASFKNVHGVFVLFCLRIILICFMGLWSMNTAYAEPFCGLGSLLTSDSAPRLEDPETTGVLKTSHAWMSSPWRLKFQVNSQLLCLLKRPSLPPKPSLSGLDRFLDIESALDWVKSSPGQPMPMDSMACEPRWTDSLNLGGQKEKRSKPCAASVCVVHGAQCRLSQRMTVGSACLCPDPLGRARHISGTAQ